MQKLVTASSQLSPFFSFPRWGKAGMGASPNPNLNPNPPPQVPFWLSL
jgi:hypothetical protein